jgi:hypothetical protein
MIKDCIEINRRKANKINKLEIISEPLDNVFGNKIKKINDKKNV